MALTLPTMHTAEIVLPDVIEQFFKHINADTEEAPDQLYALFDNDAEINDVGQYRAKDQVRSWVNDITEREDPPVGYTPKAAVCLSSPHAFRQRYTVLTHIAGGYFGYDGTFLLNFELCKDKIHTLSIVDDIDAH